MADTAPERFASTSASSGPFTTAQGDSAAAKNRQNRIVRACDNCRRRKIRCDAMGGATGPEGATAEQPCTLCASQGVPCTFEQRPQKRAPPKGYVESLERRLEAMEGLLSSLSKQDGPPSSAVSRSAAPPPVAPLPSDFGRPAATEIASSSRAPSPPPTDLDAIQGLSERLDDLVIEADRYVGRGSGFHLVQSVHDYVSLPLDTNKTTALVDNLLTDQHDRFHSLVTMPPTELCEQLVEAFFAQHSGVSSVLIHRKYFEECVMRGMVQTDKGFRSLYYAVCAVGARYVDDPRLLPPPSVAAAFPGQARLASGFAFFSAAIATSTTPFAAPCLADIQTSVLLVAWLLGATSILTSWTMIGFAVRRAIDAGAHRENRTRWSTSPLQNQLRKRAFHLLCSLDFFISSSLGRPTAVHEDDYDVELPLEITDDALWEWELAARRAMAEGRAVPDSPVSLAPSPTGEMTKWKSAVELHRIMAKALRLMYGVKVELTREKVVENVTYLDSLLNSWLANVAQPLRWNPAQQDDDLLCQSAWLMCIYYQTQILVHREFVSPSRSRALGFPSLAICSNAARATAHVVDVLRQRNVIQKCDSWAPALAVNAGLMLLLGVFATPAGPPGTARPTLTPSAASDVKRCINVLEKLRESSFMAQMCHPHLTALAALTSAPPPAARQPQPAASSPSTPQHANLKRVNPEEWADGRSPADSSRADSGGGGSDKPSPVDTASTSTSETSHKIRRVDRGTVPGLPFSTQDLSAATFNGRHTFDFGADWSTAPPVVQNGLTSAPPPAGSMNASGTSALAADYQAIMAQLAGGNASSTFGAPRIDPFALNNSMPPSAFGASTSASAATLPASAFSPTSSDHSMLFSFPDFWNLPTDNPSIAPPGIEQVAGDILSQFGLPPRQQQPFAASAQTLSSFGASTGPAALFALSPAQAPLAQSAQMAAPLGMTMQSSPAGGDIDWHTAFFSGATFPPPA
ncbi:Gypsy retrotransposon integrase-like protein 1 [Rhodotorula toruloides]